MCWTKAARKVGSAPQLQLLTIMCWPAGRISGSIATLCRIWLHRSGRAERPQIALGRRTGALMEISQEKLQR